MHQLYFCHVTYTWLFLTLRKPHMKQYRSKINVGTQEYKENYSQLLALTEELQDRLKQAQNQVLTIRSCCNTRKAYFNIIKG